jgi:phosphosulfolactate synthase (CoM biosynthesis protein A)
MFEAADYDVSAWHIRTWGPDVNLFIDHSQILAVEAQRRGLWGANELVGRVIGPLSH